MTTNQLIFTDHAAAKVWELIQEEGNFNLKLRVYVTGGGCSGFQYGFSFDENIQEDDTIINKKIILSSVNDDEIKSEKEDEEVGKNEEEEEEEEEEDKEDEEEDEEGGEGSATVQLLVDALSFQYLAGAEIDYKEDIEGEQFIIRNPNAKSTCGCGSSFST